MRPMEGNRHSWVARSTAIIAIAGVAGYLLTGTMAGAATIVGIVVFIGLMGLLYT